MEESGRKLHVVIANALDMFRTCLQEPGSLFHPKNDTSTFLVVLIRAGHQKWTNGTFSVNSIIEMSQPWIKK